MELFNSLQSNLQLLIGREVAYMVDGKRLTGKLDNVILGALEVKLVIKGEHHTLPNSTLRRLDILNHVLVFEDGTVLRPATRSDAMPATAQRSESDSQAQAASPAGQMVQPGQQLPHKEGSYHPS